VTVSREPPSTVDVRLILVAMASGLAACECTEGESWCTGDGITRCKDGRATISSCCARDGCRDVEIEGVPTAVCSATNSPDPRCAGAAPIDDVCVDGVRLHCVAGYSSSEQTCSHACVTPGPGIALCALDGVPDPRCDERIASHCSGNAIVSCAFGYAIAEEPCVAPFDTCVDDRDNLGAPRARCATALPDPACAGDPPGRCSGLDILGCAEGRRTIAHCEHSCFQNPVDSMFPEAFCDGPACSFE
jgi:hypothetical protein